MSRSSNPARVVLVSVVAVVGLAVGSGVSHADDQSDVRDIVAPVLDIETGISDLQGAARVEESQKEIKVRLSSSVLFAKDSPKLQSGALERLGEVGDQLRQKGPGTVKIVGYTDDLGSAEHGRVLSLRRAQAVATFLRKKLSKADFPFTVAGRGEADPAVPNDSEANRQKNRRVELTYRVS